MPASSAQVLSQPATKLCFAANNRSALSHLPRAPERRLGLVEAVGHAAARAVRRRAPALDGDLGFFNREFRQRRLEAQAAGKPFPSYMAVRLRLRRALVGVTAGELVAIVREVFGGLLTPG
jgi:hypothetical protein